MESVRQQRRGGRIWGATGFMRKRSYRRTTRRYTRTDVLCESGNADDDWVSLNRRGG